MATIKSYTDIEQSRKLAEILPVESADMWYHGHGSPWESEREYDNDACPFHSMKPNWDKPSWSLAALLDVLPNYTDYDTIRNPSLIKNLDNNYMVIYSALKYSGIYDNPVDACYDMIIKLHELNLL